MQQLTPRTIVRSISALAVLLLGVLLIPYIDRPAAALEWRMMAGVYAPELTVHEAEGAPVVLLPLPAQVTPPTVWQCF